MPKSHSPSATPGAGVQGFSLGFQQRLGHTVPDIGVTPLERLDKYSLPVPCARDL